MRITVIHGERGEHFQDALAIRKRVFTDEQGFPEEIDHDEQDRDALHLILYLIEGCHTPDGAIWRGEPVAIGTARLFTVEGERKIGQIGRLAVLKEYRGIGLGGMLIRQIIEKVAVDEGYQELHLNAQLEVAPFYQRLGFDCKGEPFDEEGVLHILMVRDL